MGELSLALPTIPGMLSPWVGKPIPFMTLESDVTVDRLDVSVTDVGTGLIAKVTDGSTVVTVTVADQERYGTVAPVGATFPAGATLSLVVDVVVGTPMNLSGSLSVTTAGGLAPSSGVFLTDLTRVKLYINEQGASKDDLINEIIAGTSREMERWMNRAIVQQIATTMLLPQTTGLGPAFLNEWPISGTVVVTAGGTVVPDGEYTIVGRQLWTSTANRRRGAAWPADTEITVQGDVGYAAIPLDLQQAATVEVCSRFLMTADRRFGVTSKTTEAGTTMTYAEGPFLESTVTAMLPYQRRQV